MQDRMRSLILKTLPVASSIALWCLVPINSVRAQITPDGTLVGTERSAVTPNININGLPIDRIDGGARRGVNLFHSFGDFNVNAGRGVYFTNPAGIENILSRVTGSNASNILGTLGVLGNANLFLLNPNGIVFGPNARLDVRGSFLATTASSLVFGNGLEFSATSPQAPPLLAVNIPIGLQFRDNSESITNRSATTDSIGNLVGLQVPLGKTLALVGGNINIEGGILTAPSGRIELGSVAGNSLVNLTSKDTGLTLGYQGVQTFQDIQLSGQSLVSANGEGGGNIQVQGRHITLTGGSQITADTLGSQAGGTLAVNASELVEVSGRSPDGQTSSSLNTVTLGNGNAGNTMIKTGRLIVQDGAGVGTGAFSTGKGGNLSVTAKESVEVIGRSLDGQFASVLVAGTFSTGDAGNVTIETGRLIIRDGASIGAATVSAGKAGNVSVTAKDSVELSGTSLNGQSSSNLVTGTFSTGDAGNVTIETGRLIIRDGASVGAGTVSAGKAGNVKVTASEVDVIGRSPNGQSPSELVTETRGTGDAGNVTIDTGQLIIRDGALIAAGTLALNGGNAGNVSITAGDLVELIGLSPDKTSNSNLSALTQLSTLTGGTGDAGNVTIKTRRLILRDGAVVQTGTLGTGKAGNVSVTAGDSVELSGIRPNSLVGQIGSSLSAGTFSSTGDAGNVTIQTGRLILRDAAQVSATTLFGGKAGNVSVTAKDSVELSGSSNLTAATVFGTGDAGNVTIQTGRLILRDAAQITTATISSTGKAGNVSVTAKDSVKLSGSGGLSAATIFSTGDGGNVTVATRKLMITDGAQVNVNGQGQGTPGTIDITARNLRLDNQGLITAVSDTGKGGNIRLQVRDILLRHQSAISAAGSQTNPTTEGNIGINAETLVLLERSGIITSATDPIGGSNIRISPLNGSDLVIFKSPDSIINAVGNLTIDTQLQLTPGDIPQVAVPDPNEQIAQNPCTRGKSSEFTITGRGGLPPNPNEALSSDAVGVGLVDATSSNQGRGSHDAPAPTPKTPIQNLKSTIQNPIVPAQGWIFNDKGQVVLTAYNPAVTQPQRPWRNPGACHAL